MTFRYNVIVKEGIGLTTVDAVLSIRGDEGEAGKYVVKAATERGSTHEVTVWRDEGKVKDTIYHYRFKLRFPYSVHKLDDLDITLCFVPPEGEGPVKVLGQWSGKQGQDLEVKRPKPSCLDCLWCISCGALGTVQSAKKWPWIDMTCKKFVPATGGKREK